MSGKCSPSQSAHGVLVRGLTGAVSRPALADALTAAGFHPTFIALGTENMPSREPGGPPQRAVFARVWLASAGEKTALLERGSLPVGVCFDSQLKCPQVAYPKMLLAFRGPVAWLVCALSVAMGGIEMERRGGRVRP